MCKIVSNNYVNLIVTNLLIGNKNDSLLFNI